MGKLFYIMGKSASGKDHIYEALLRDPAPGAFAAGAVYYPAHPAE